MDDIESYKGMLIGFGVIFFCCFIFLRNFVKGIIMTIKIKKMDWDEKKRNSKESR